MILILQVITVLFDSPLLYLKKGFLHTTLFLERTFLLWYGYKIYAVEITSPRELSILPVAETPKGEKAVLVPFKLHIIKLCVNTVFSKQLFVSSAFCNALFC